MASTVLAGETDKLLDVVNASESAQAYHHCVYANGHIYLFGLKGAEQNTYSSYKRTVLLGSYAVDVDLESKTFKQSYFSSIDKAEDRKEHVFALGGQVYMITYSEYEMCTFHDLYTWMGGSWKPVALTVESKAKFASGKPRSSCKLSYTVVGNDSVLLSFSHGGNSSVIFSRLTIAGEGAVISHLFTVDKLSKGKSGVVFAGLHDQKLTAVTTSLGCGLRWNSDEVLSVDLKQGNVAYHPTGGERPPWAFNGPAATYQWNDKMLLVGGSRALGISSVSFSPEIWTLDQGSRNYTKLAVQVPAEVANFQMCSTFDPDSSQLFFTDLAHGVYRIKLAAEDV
uniref:Uncharacterized protein n=1 Tax=Trichuris muris TaxID=70415 RepID=A0A5S6QLX2_TRIMR